MSSNLVRYSVDSTVAPNRRKLSATLWRNALDNCVRNDYEHGAVYREDYIDGVGGGANVAVNSGTQTFAKIAAANGVVRVGGTTGTDHMGSQAAFPAVGDIVLNASKRTVYEASVNLRKGSTWYVGLFETGEVAFAASSAIPDKDFVGFRRVNGGDIYFVYKKTGVTEQTVSVVAAADITDSAGSDAVVDYPINLGFAVNGNRSVDVCVDGVIKAAEQATIVVTAANLPTAVLTRVAAVLRGATDDEATVALDIDWQASYAEAV